MYVEPPEGGCVVSGTDGNGDPIYNCGVTISDDVTAYETGGELEDDDPCWGGFNLDPTCYTSPQGQTVYGSPAQRTMPVSNAIMSMELKAAMALAQKMLTDEPNCAGLFGLTGAVGNTSPAALTGLALIANSFSFGAIGPTSSSTTTSATTTGVGSLYIPLAGGGTIEASANVSIVLNNISNNASFVMGNTYDEAVTILHELGHAYWDLFGPGTSAIVPDHSSTPTSQTNTNLVTKNCK
jgi:hypothetical protein